VYEKIAALGKPILFHSGILYDGRNDSGNFNRPCNFEGLLSVRGLRFALAHVSWPWTDECISVYGKFNHVTQTEKGGGAGEMFIDLSPGTPRSYRKAVFDRLLFSGYNIKKNLLYGIDSSIGPYGSAHAKSTLEFDEAIFDEYYKNGGMYGVKLDGDFREHLYCKNLLRFVGMEG